MHICLFFNFHKIFGARDPLEFFRRQFGKFFPVSRKWRIGRPSSTRSRTGTPWWTGINNDIDGRTRTRFLRTADECSVKPLGQIHIAHTPSGGPPDPALTPPEKFPRTVLSLLRVAAAQYLSIYKIIITSGIENTTRKQNISLCYGLTTVLCNFYVTYTNNPFYCAHFKMHRNRKKIDGHFSRSLVVFVDLYQPGSTRIRCRSERLPGLSGMIKRFLSIYFRRTNNL